MTMDYRETEIQDMNGTSWKYVTTPLPFDDALSLKLEIGDAVLSSVLNLAGGGEEDEVNLAALADIPRKLIERGGPALVSRLFASTFRIIDGKKRPVRDPQVRTLAYAGGNWTEFYSAVKWVLDVNYGPFLALVSERLGVRWTGLQSE